MAVIGDGVLQAVGHHSVFAAVRVAAQVVVDDLERLRPIVVVGVDDGKGAVDEGLGGQRRLGGAPGLGPPLWDGVALRQVVHALEGVSHIHMALHPGADALLEIRLDLMLDDENHRLKSRPPGVVDGIIQNDLVVTAYGVHLLAPAVAAAHARGHDDEDRLFHGKYLLGRNAPVRW